MDKRDFLLLSFILIFGFVTRFYRLDYTQGQLIFDERKYYHQAALAYLQNKDDPNFEHPPLAKELIAYSISLMGDDAYGWRTPVLIFSLLGNLVIYFLIKDLTQNRTAAFLTSFFLSLDPLYLIHSRLMVPEMILAVLSWLSLLCLYRYLNPPTAPSLRSQVTNLGLGLIFFALSLSTKWSAVLLLVPILIFALSQKKFRHLLILLASLPLLTTIIYLLAYSPYLLRHGLPSFLPLQAKIIDHWVYYSEEFGLKLNPSLYLLNHASAWILNPSWAYNFNHRGSQVQMIWALYHPLLWFFSIALLLKQVFKNGLGHLQEPQSRLTVLALSFYLPWLVVSRIEYPYYFLSGLPFLYALAALKVHSWLGTNRPLFLTFMVVALILFALLYPLITNQWVSESYLTTIFRFRVN